MVSHLSDSFYHKKFLLYLLLMLALWLLNACAPQPPVPSPGHINTAAIPPPKDDIPPLVQQRAFVPLPQPTPPLETFTVVVDRVPVDKLLFALARDAGLNIDIHPGIEGQVTLNAINQTLPQLLERIAKQVDLRYQILGTYLSISPDYPFMRLYEIGYVNMSRDSRSEVTVSTQIASTGQGITQGGNSSSNLTGNNSITRISNESNNRFWDNLEKNILAILSDTRGSPDSDKADKVIVNPESGIVTVRATSKQHEEVQRFIDQVLASIQRQVLIEATVVEVQLSDQYQAGVDWQRIAGDFTYSQQFMGGNLLNPPTYSFTYNNPNSQFGNISAAVRLLEQFGTVKVLSSPKIMALNNQTAILKVVDNTVYFEIDVEVVDATQTTLGRTTYETTINTVPVGLVMAVTPQISKDNTVILNVRPTISRIIRYVKDPNPFFAVTGVTSEIPEIQVREIESILKINHGDIAIIGGLMQDTTKQNRDGIPVLSQLPLVGDLFSYRNDQYEKNELVIFLRPVVVKEANLSGDLQDYRVYLPEPSQSDGVAPTGLTPP